MSNIFDQFPIIKLKNNFFLRQIQLDNDYEDFYHYITHPQVAKYLSFDDIPSNIESARNELGYWERMYNRRASIYWAIAFEKGNKIIGTAGFNFWNQEQRRAEISYDLDHQFWGKGIMTDSIGAITNFGLEEMKVQRIQATVAIDNFASIKVLEKNGYQREGILKKYGFLQGESVDFFMYARTQEF